jgi:hypothetical protein
MFVLNKTILLILMLFLLCYSQEQPDGDDKIRVSHDENLILFSGKLLDINPYHRYWEFKINYTIEYEGIDTTERGSIIRISNLKYWCPDNKFEANKDYLVLAPIHKKNILAPFIVKCKNILLDTPKNKEILTKEYEEAGSSGYMKYAMCINECKSCGNQVYKTIRNIMPITAEYCLLESSKKELYGKWEVRLTNILDTITKIYPYEYEDLRNCIWNEDPYLWLVSSLDYVDRRNIQNNGYNDSDVPETANTIADYYNILRDKFYIGIKYQKVWSGNTFEFVEITLNSNYTGVVPVSWTLGGPVCLPIKENQKDNTCYTFEGEYSIRITGKCTKADMKKLQEMGNLDYPPEEGGD